MDQREEQGCLADSGSPICEFELQVGPRVLKKKKKKETRMVTLVIVFVSPALLTHCASFNIFFAIV